MQPKTPVTLGPPDGAAVPFHLLILWILWAASASARLHWRRCSVPPASWRRAMRAFVCVALVAVSTAAPLAAQDSTASGAPGQLCFRAKPKPACSAFLLTNFGGYLALGRDQSGGTPLRGIADFGFMVNVTTRDAIGASVFASLDRDGFNVGPAAHYRRWITASASFEVGVGAPLVITAEELDEGRRMEPGSVFGLLKWSPNDEFAVAARPELLRQSVWNDCRPTTCAWDVQSRGRVSLGVEFGAKPGLALTAASGIAVLVMFALFLATYGT